MDKLSKPEKKILKALNIEHGTKFKDDQLMEWSTAKVEAQAGERVFHVTEYSVNVAIKLKTK